MSARRADAELHAELRRPGEHGRLPALKPRAQDLAELTVDRARRIKIFQSDTVGWVGTEESSGRGRRRRPRQLPKLELHPMRDARPLGVCTRVPHGRGITILTPNDRLRLFTREAATVCFSAHVAPQGLIMSAPAE